jgi:hypothetical protein
MTSDDRTSQTTTAPLPWGPGAGTGDAPPSTAGAGSPGYVPPPGATFAPLRRSGAPAAVALAGAGRRHRGGGRPLPGLRRRRCRACDTRRRPSCPSDYGRGRAPAPVSGGESAPQQQLAKVAAAVQPSIVSLTVRGPGDRVPVPV